jgi:hypothetical protein
MGAVSISLFSGIKEAAVGDMYRVRVERMALG